MAADWGTLHDIKCDNMVDQFHKNKEKQQKMEKKPLGILTVVSGVGWTELFEKSGCDVVSGGQSMNPSVQELSAGMENGQYEKYIILPNNKNIILAAQQLKKMLGEKVHIVPSTNPMEGWQLLWFLMVRPLSRKILMPWPTVFQTSGAV